MAERANSPAATGPGGEHFEAKVGAFYLLAMLLDAEPRGLPGAHIERIQLQGANEGSPLDDVIVHATRNGGTEAVLEIQAKRTISFSPNDGTFRDVAQQIAKVLNSGALSDPVAHRVGVATAQGSRQIDGPYQEVLLWARNSETPDVFFRKIERRGASNEAMRTFVATLRSHLAESNVASDDLAVWTVLRAFQLLVFDFSAEAGQSEALALDRCVHALDPSDRGKAGALWSALADIAQEVATAGGDISAPTLRGKLVTECGLRLAGTRNSRAARAALSEASQNALRDIRDRVGSATLSRRARLDDVNAALDASDYVEVRGDAGVGKSGILRALAEEAAGASTIIVLSPTRTTPRGWAAMRDVFGFEASASDFMSEVAAAGGATLFLDGLDFFGEAERATVIDLVRAAASVPGFKIVATARRSFGDDERNWLADEVEATFGRTTVNIDELTEGELDELKSAAAELLPLLASSHPAREVARNLFRLDRLVSRPGGGPLPRTEAEMARLWWDSGDGAAGAQARERSRILRDLGEGAISERASVFSTRTFAAVPLHQLVVSATLLDLGGERMTFRHDVFRDWAVANVLREDGSKVDILPLHQLAPAALGRGVELAARFAIEDVQDDANWKALLDKLSAANVHGSWRRAALIALVRSELGENVLDRAGQRLLEDEGYLLRELIRTLLAVEMAPAGRLLASANAVVRERFATLQIPTGPTWRRLSAWLYARRSQIPANAIPEVVELFWSYASTYWPIDPLARDLTAQLHTWLTELEEEEALPPGARGSLFGGGLEYDRKRPLRDSLRSKFAALSVLQPELADRYLRLLLGNRRHSGDSAESIVKSPGSFAEAAPNALAKLTAAVLINDEPPQRGFGPSGRDEPFMFADHQFMSPSPARGPFFDLLLKGPADGLALIRQLVMHACTYGSNKSVQEAAAVTVNLDCGPRSFPYPGSYLWSRQSQGQYAVTSALMALEAWGHQRIDGGESVEAVIADVLGDEIVPAAYLLVIVDLILSHWPQSRVAAIPFVGTPEILAWDRTRQIHERMGFDIRGISEGEPAGGVTLDSLKKRVSRKLLLEQVLSEYAFGPNNEAAAVRVRLEYATTRLGPYGPEAGYGDAPFMAIAALNRLTPDNYQEVRVEDDDGNEQTVQMYVAPESEVKHLEPMQAKINAQTADANLRAQVAMAIDDPAKSSRELARRSAEFARQLEESGAEQHDFDNSILMAAAIVMRDSDKALRDEHGAWAKAQFQKALKLGEDPVHRMRSGLQFNPAGIAILGLTEAVRHGEGLADVRPLLEAAATGDPAFAHGFEPGLAALAAIDPRLPTSILRCAFVGNVRPHLRPYDPEQAGDDEVLKRDFAATQSSAVVAEWRWLTGEDSEPAWPLFPDDRVIVKRRMRIGGDTPDESEAEEPSRFYADHQALAVWLSKFLGRQYAAPDWLRTVANTYCDWTSRQNGAGLDRGNELSHSPREWNQAYYRLVARSLVGLTSAEIDQLCVAPVVCLPDEAFLDVMSELLSPLDTVFFDHAGIGESDAIRLRSAFAARMEKTAQWWGYTNRPGYGVEFHLGLALPNLFFCESGFREPPRCYVTKLGMHRLPPFMSLLAEVAARGPSLHMAMMAMSIVTVSPDYPLLEFGSGIIDSCLKRFPDETPIWLDYGIGRSFCTWIEGVITTNGGEALEKAGVRAQIEAIVSSLIRLGLAEATTLERLLVVEV